MLSQLILSVAGVFAVSFFFWLLVLSKPSLRSHFADDGEQQQERAKVIGKTAARA